jgi:hypothetical protein
VTIQAQILDLLRDLQKERGMALVLVTHNMGVVAEMARRVAVMYAGQVMEERGSDALFAAPQHPYTAALLAAMPERHCGQRPPAPRSRASFPACTIARSAVSSPRAARTQRPPATTGRRCGHGRTASSAATIPSAIRCASKPRAGSQGGCGMSAAGRLKALIARPWGSEPGVRRAWGTPYRRRSQDCGASTTSAAACSRSPRTCRRSAAFRSRSKPRARSRSSANRDAASRRSRASSR